MPLDYSLRIAVLSDIHGNIAALDAVLADVASRQVDLTVNLGDICSGALFPRQTAERLMPLNLPTIRGNHERQILEQPTERMGPSDHHAATALTSDQLEWLASLPKTLRLRDEVLLVHGTPDSDLSYFLETVTEAGLREATAHEVASRAGDVFAKVILCGHTHIPRMVRLADGRLVLNPGSVGLPAFADDMPHRHVVEMGSPAARYAVLTRLAVGWVGELLSVEYDCRRAAEAAKANGRDDWARALLTGRV